MRGHAASLSQRSRPLLRARHREFVVDPLLHAVLLAMPAAPVALVVPEERPCSDVARVLHGRALALEIDGGLALRHAHAFDLHLALVSLLLLHAAREALVHLGGLGAAGFAPRLGGFDRIGILRIETPGAFGRRTRVRAVGEDDPSVGAALLV